MYKALRIIVISIILMSYNLAGTAQDVETYSFPVIQKFDIKGATFYITDVIDARTSTTPKHLGFVYKGIGVFFKEKEAVLDKEVAEAIRYYLKLNFPKRTKTDSIILRINQLGISEKATDGTEKTVFAANFDFIRRTPQGYYLIDNQNIFFYKNAFWAGHVSNIIAGLEMAFNQFQQGKRWALPTDSLVAVDSAALTRVPKARILTDTVFKKGVYTSFKSFRNNAPTIPDYKFMDNEYGVRFLAIPGRDDEYRAVETNDMIWGFCDGEKLYIHHNGYYVPLTFKDSNAFFNGFSLNRRDENIAKGGFVFGLIGAAVASTTSGDPALYELKMDCGEIKMIELLRKK